MIERKEIEIREVVSREELIEYKVIAGEALEILVAKTAKHVKKAHSSNPPPTTCHRCIDLGHLLIFARRALEDFERKLQELETPEPNS